MKKDDFNKLCRTCLAINVDMAPLVDKNMIQLLEDCASVKLGKGMFSTKMICTHCCRILEGFLAFKRKCLEIEEYVTKIEKDLAQTTNGMEMDWQDDINRDEEIKNEVIDVKFDEDMKVGQKEEVLTDESDDERRRRKTKKRPKKPIVEKSSGDLQWYKCHMCDKRFSIRASIQRHVKEHFHKNRRCAWCQKFFDSFSSMIAHYPQHEELKPHFECAMCPAKLYTKDELEFHHGMTHIHRSCALCYKTFPAQPTKDKDVKLREKHLLVKHGVKIVKPRAEKDARFKCVACSCAFHSGADLTEHMREHPHVSATMKCAQCVDAAFFVIEQLSEHMLEQHMRDDFACPHCMKTHRTLGGLKRHILSAHSSNSDKSTNVTDAKMGGGKGLCTICGKTVNSITHHLQTAHEKSKKITCQLCSESFDTWKEFITHRRANHAGVNTARTHQCDICQRWFAKRNLYHHKRDAHSDVRPHHCTICSSTFKKPRHLRLHMRQHTDERPHQCSFCDMKFRQTTTLNNHELIHKQEKPHRCEYCGVNFRQRIALTGHVASQHPGMKASVVKVAE